MIWCLISNDFEASRHEDTFKYLTIYFDNANTGMNTEKYLAMCLALGDEPDPNKIPPDYNSFPPYVHTGIDIFNSLPDTYSGGMSPVYAGKNFSSLTALFDIFQVDSRSERMQVFEVIRFLDTRARKQAIREAEKAAKKSR